MGILDDAIKEHLELKRQHGADDSELKQLENEAFGATERPGAEGSAPDSLAEAPTEFMAQPDLAQPAEPEQSGPAPEEEPAEKESPAMEHEAVPEAEAPPESVSPSGPTTEEREAIAEQPTEMYDVEEELASSQALAPSEEDLLEGEMEEPRLAPVDPLAGLDEGDSVADTGAGVETDDEEYEEDDDFWDEKRLSDELDQALEAPSDVEEERSVFEEEPEVDDEPEPEATAEPEAEAEEPPAARQEEDVLEETPDFLEEAPEDDRLWFEQKPPKDFDFDD